MGWQIVTFTTKCYGKGVAIYDVYTLGQGGLRGGGVQVYKLKIVQISCVTGRERVWGSINPVTLNGRPQTIP